MPSHKRRIYLLSPRELSPETIAVAFAKTSRSPESFREIATGLSDEAFEAAWAAGQAMSEEEMLAYAMEAEP